MKIRVKTHHMPGEVSQQTMIKMLEGRHPNKKRAKNFKREVLSRERAVHKKQTEVLIKEQLGSVE